MKQLFNPALFVLEKEVDKGTLVGTVHRTRDNEYVASIVLYVPDRRPKTIRSTSPVTHLEAAIFELQADKSMVGAVEAM